MALSLAGPGSWAGGSAGRSAVVNSIRVTSGAGSGPATGRGGEITQVSLEPPPWLELTTSSPSGSATRVSPPGSTHTLEPSLTAKGRRSTCRGAIRPLIRVGDVDSPIGFCAIQSRGAARTLTASSSRVCSSARGPMTMPLPPDPSTGLSTSWSSADSTHSVVSASSSR
jgi:hypothetical protein